MEIDFSKLINVTGIDDLFILSNTQNDKVMLRSLKTNNMIVQSINRGKVMNLSNIQVYITDGMMDLKDLLILLKNSTETLPSITADKQTYYDFFLKICPNIDKQKVYLSNLKQILKWHILLLNTTFSNPKF